MTVKELTERLAGADPDAVVLLWAIDPNDPNSDGHYPLTGVEVGTGVKTADGDWIMGRYAPDSAVPAVWLE